MSRARTFEEILDLHAAPGGRLTAREVEEELTKLRDVADTNRAAYEQAAEVIARVRALAEQWRGRHDLVMTGDSAAHDLTAALVSAPLLSSTAPSENSRPGVLADGPAPQPDEPIDLCAALQRSIDAAKESRTPPTTDTEEANDA